MGVTRPLRGQLISVLGKEQAGPMKATLKGSGEILDFVTRNC